MHLQWPHWSGWGSLVYLYHISIFQVSSRAIIVAHRCVVGCAIFANKVRPRFSGGMLSACSLAGYSNSEWYETRSPVCQHCMHCLPHSSLVVAVDVCAKVLSVGYVRRGQGGMLLWHTHPAVYCIHTKPGRAKSFPLVCLTKITEPRDGMGRDVCDGEATKLHTHTSVPWTDQHSTFVTIVEERELCVHGSIFVSW